jgi:hypothetical protein
MVANARGRGRTYSRRELLGAAAALACVQSISACAKDSTLTPVSDAPFVFVVLTSSQAPIGGPSQADSSIMGLLLTVGSPISSPFRRAERFEMRRASDGALFGWAERTPSSSAGGADFRGISSSDGNYLLNHATTASGLGSDSIRALESYTLTIDTQGSRITGVATVPAIPQLRVVVEGSRRFIVWGRVSGAAGYIQGPGGFFQGFLTSDTLIELRSDPQFALPPITQFGVIALDTNAFRYLSDTTRASAGLVGGLGLFGAASAATISVPNP